VNVLFFGTPAFAVPSLDALAASSHALAGVVTQPDRPSGRGQRLTSPPVKLRAAELGLRVWQPASVRTVDWLAQVRELDLDLGVVVAYGKILPRELLELPRHGMINVHASLLPRYRGAAPVQRAVMAGEVETGVTIIRLVEALDAGPMLATARQAIGPDDTAEDVEASLARLGAGLLVETIDRLAEGRSLETAQDDSQATYAPKLTKGEGAIDWTAPARAIHDRVRGLQPWPLAHTYFRGARLVIHRTSVSPAPAANTNPPGRIVAVGESLVAACGNGRLHVHELQPEGRRVMRARDFASGHRVAAGDSFTPGP
jgi:methionyl-tRNA formyltransferase